MNTKKLLTFAFYFYVVLAVSVCNSYSPVEPLVDLYNLENLPRLRSGVKCKMFSSYDRTGGNNDGFNGTYSKLRLENGCSVLAEMSGPGVIQRIWFTHSLHKKDGLLALKQEHIKIFIDGADTPALDVPLEDVFSGKLPQFPEPLAGSAIGGFYCYVPIPYKDGCKILVEGDDVKFYHITYSEFPSGDDIESFSMQMSPVRSKHLERAVKAWSNPGDAAAFGLADCEKINIPLDVKPTRPTRFDLPAGSHMIRALYLDENSGLSTSDTVRLQLFYDSAETPAVDVPLLFFFGKAFNPAPYRSLMLGNTAEGCYNFFPMPYRQNARLKVISPEPFKGKIRLLLQSIPEYTSDLAYLHALYTRHNPAKPDVYYPWLVCNGTGHYAGTYLITEGPKGLPYWLEGDERFTIDGRLSIHGTGSEDYFNCGWYAVENRLNKPGALPLHGFPVYRENVDPTRAVAYRWHIADPVPYEKSIVAEIEHGGDNKFAALYRSVTYFYDTRPGNVSHNTPKIQ
jgi:hypothetical protein